MLATSCDDGRLNTYVMAKQPFNEWTSGDDHWQFMNDEYEAMVVWAPYWDRRLSSYDDVRVYKNAYAVKVDSGSDTRSKDNPDWILRDETGQPVYIDFACTGGCPQFAGDIGNPAFVQDWIDDLRETVQRGYRGVFIDDVNLLWRFSDSTGDRSIKPIDPRTGQVLTLEVWNRYLVEFLETVRAAFPDLEIWHNGLWYADSPGFTDPLADRQILAADVVQLERGMNDRGLVGGTRKFGMQTFMSYIDRVHALGRNVALLDENAVDEAGQWFNIAGALLVNNGGDYVSTEDWDFISPDRTFGGFDIDLGTALGPRRVVDGTIQREFTGGLVIMNEPKSPPSPSNSRKRGSRRAVS